MASDLSSTPVTGLEAQICGDAHLANFGLYGSPERDLVFDLNDFDETLRGPWEWDLKRLAASFAIAARHNGFKQADIDASVQSSVRGYRDTMANLTGRPILEIWYMHVRAEDIAPFMAHEFNLNAKREKEIAKQTSKRFAKARSRDSHQALSKLAVEVDGEYQFISDPPFVVPISDLLAERHPDEVRAAVSDAFESYKSSLPDSRRYLIERYDLKHVALKVVGVGSVGTRCYIALFVGHYAQDPLILQVKEAGRVRPCRVPGSKSIRQSGPASGCWTTHDANSERHLPRLGTCCCTGRQTGLLLAATSRHEAVSPHRRVRAVRDEWLRSALRAYPGSRSCSDRGSGFDFGIHGL